MPDNQPVRIDVVSDVVCPWCFIGKHRLEKALALRPGDRGRGALPALFSQRLDSARRHFTRGVSDDEIRLARALQGHRPARRRSGSGRRAGLCLRQDETSAQYARLPSADPLGGGNRQGGRDEAEADGSLFHRRRRPHRPRHAGESRRRRRARRQQSARGAGKRPGRRRRRTGGAARPRKPASRACLASSSAASSRCRARRRRNISPMQSTGWRKARPRQSNYAALATAAIEASLRKIAAVPFKPLFRPLPVVEEHQLLALGVLRIGAHAHGRALLADKGDQPIRIGENIVAE